MFKALIRLDSGEGFGLGHFVRSKALADALARNDIQCTIAAIQIHEQVVLPHQLILLQSDNEFISLAQDYDVVIVDHYQFQSDQFYQLSQVNKPLLVVIDDECNRGRLYADMIVNSVNKVFDLLYQQHDPQAQLYLGPNYVLLRNEFKLQNPPAFNERDSIVITFGGADVTRLTLPLLEQLKIVMDAGIDNITKIKVVTGPACQQLNEIKQFCADNSFEYFHNVADMQLLFNTAKLAISAAGTTAYELANCSVPAVYAVVADNQYQSIRMLSEYDFCDYVDCRVSNQVELLVEKALLMLNDPKLQVMSEQARTVVDGNGAERIAKAIKNKLTDTMV